MFFSVRRKEQNKNALNNRLFKKKLVWFCFDFFRVFKNGEKNRAKTIKNINHREQTQNQL